jgi:adhesin/invasin
VPDVTFTATATAGAAAQALAVSTTNLGNVVVNSLVATPPSVRVLDALGNPVAGAEVTFVVTPSDTTGALTDSVRVTDANGIATVGSWRVGKLANVTTSLKAFVTGLSLGGAEPTFTATTIAGAAAAIAPAPGSSQVQAAAADAAVGSIPAVRVTDAFGNSVAGVEVTFTAEAGNGTVVGSPVTSDANGIARITSWTMPSGAGARTLTASVAGTSIPVVVFTANAS